MREVESTVQSLLEEPNNQQMLQELDAVVYKIYSLTEDEQKIVEQRYRREEK